MRCVFPVKSAFNLIITTLCLFCLALPSAFADGLMNVYVVNYPLKYFAERIGGPHVKVTLPVPPDVDPVYWIPSIADISAYQQADLILLNGAGYAKWITKVSLPHSKTIDTSRSFKDRYITVKEIMTHSHGPEGEHAHEGLAFTTWINLDLAAQQAKAIAKALSRKKPDLKDTFQKNFVSLEKDLIALDMEIKKIVAKNQSQPLIASHPVYDYFAKRYGLNMKSVHWEPDEMPDTKEWIELNNILKDHQAKWMIWEGKPIRDSVKKLKLIGVASFVFDPCSNTPEKGDFLSVMRENVANLRTAFE
jgi:zinc transport system substrate-binding protein